MWGVWVAVFSGHPRKDELCDFTEWPALPSSWILHFRNTKHEMWADARLKGCHWVKARKYLAGGMGIYKNSQESKERRSKNCIKLMRSAGYIISSPQHFFFRWMLVLLVVTATTCPVFFVFHVVELCKVTLKHLINIARKVLLWPLDRLQM